MGIKFDGHWPGRSWLLSLMLMGGGILAVSCSDNATNGGNVTPFDASKDVVITEFTPDSATARAKMFIFGKNFGTDISKINVSVGGEQATIVGSDGECIYCLVPPHSSGKVEVECTDGTTTKKATSTSEFSYIFKPVVNTLIRNVDQYGKSSMKDGPFEEAGVVNPYWLTVDPKDPTHVFYIEWGANVRLIDLKNRVVSTCIPSGAGGMKRPTSACWSFSGDSLLISNAAGGSTTNNANAVLYLSRADNFKSIHSLVASTYSPSVAVNPVDGEIYYVVGRNSQIFHYNKQTHQSEVVGSYLNMGTSFRMFFHPSGKWMYLFDEYHGFIAKANYDFATKTVEAPIIFAGNYSERGYQDGVGTDARFSWGYQGVFIKNNEYVKEGKEDVYDFYITDAGNNCIRILTPEGRMTTFAGRGSAGVISSDSQGTDPTTKGYIEGDIRKEARFNWPDGIYYDDVNQIFYIADYYNHAIRYINMAE